MKKIMAENILEEVKLTNREILEAVNQYPVEAGAVKTIRTIHSTTDIIRLLDAQLLKAIPIIERAERKSIIKWLETYASFHDDYTAYMRLSWNEWQALRKGKGGGE